MNKITNYFGIDISKGVFDVCNAKGKSYQFDNNDKGFKRFLSLLDINSHVVMEATGYYHYQLAYYLIKKSITVSVENPLSIKRFIQMKLSKIKTDKSDAKMICLYAQHVDLKIWKGQTINQRECLQILSTLKFLIEQSTALKNKIQGETILKTPSKSVAKVLKKTLSNIQKQITLLEKELIELVKLDNQDLLTRITSIPSLGKKTAAMLIVLTNNFENCSSASELRSFSGLTPIIRQSGSSIKGKPRISKMGNQDLRNALFMCAMSAVKWNKSCKALYERIIAKGKSKKLALIAVCNKLLSQAYAIAKSGLIYDENYRSTLTKNN